MSIVVLGLENDPHLPFVLPHLEDDCKVVTLGSPTTEISFEFDVAHPTPVITYNKQVIDLATVRSVWLRNVAPRWLWPTLRTNPPEALEYVRSSLDHQAASMVALLSETDAFWVSPQPAIKRAEHKPTQLKRARELGFQVPATLFTSDAKRAEAFVREHGRVIVKAMAHCAPPDMDQYSQPKTVEELRFDGLQSNPHIFQALITPEIEARVTVAGKQVFASKVGDGDEEATVAQGMRDFRYAFNTGHFQSEAIVLPDEIAEKCRQLVYSFGTVLGCMDLIRDLQGNWWFIENNPNGQWAFQDQATNVKIGRAVAHLLNNARI